MAAFTRTVLALVALCFCLVSAQNIFTPSDAFECQDLTLSWEGGVAPFFVSVVKADDPCADSLADIPETNGNSVTWKVNITAGTTVAFTLEDGNGDESWTGDVTIKPGSSSSCLVSAAVKEPQDGSSSKSSSSTSKTSTSSSTSTSTSSTITPPVDIPATSTPALAAENTPATTVVNDPLENAGGAISGALPQLSIKFNWLAVAVTLVGIAAL
ncbi:hypothetical protein SISNIDRAFT_453988 [Sistotremastrum niveocremeum HHB9708]|uniref:Uncharacterized protein n=2 Tax=Sistotremastraceae TaxID=3402574 RepID=A0A164VL30_9AGAM|nr:hypothetical protein SISNIDRAFT_453988 [Sistotremastrum niveocremeum HHB9708]KZT41202.1 hypothetical protein SISSUDRAFT_1043031 [Sistotremastrum suecicum HHB10207 ss-3]